MFDNFEKYQHETHGWVRLPSVSISEEEKASVGLISTASNIEFLKALARKGFSEKVKGKLNEQIYIDRVKNELTIIEKLGFTDYYLLVWKVCKTAHEKGIAMDYGRGSAPGSLVFWLVGYVSLVDPIKYDLFFERFISEARAKIKKIGEVVYIDGELAPDVDLDFAQEDRHKMIDYLHRTYPNKVSKISTISTLSGKALIKECGKIIGGYSDSDMKEVSDLIPKVHGVVADIEEAYGGKKDKTTGEVKLEANEQFKRWCDENALVYKTALKLRDLNRNKGLHPSGYVVSHDDLETFLPVEYTKSEEGEEREIASAFDMSDVALLTIKLDLLGVRCCSVIADVLKNENLSITDINVDSDPIIYNNLQNLESPHGLFQLEAFTNLRVAKKIKPRNLEELMAVVAIARPGALAYLDAYEQGSAPAPHPFLEDVLKTTRNQVLYQEQVLQILNKIGFTKGESEIARRVIGKKKIEEVDKWKSKITNKIRENKLDEGLVPVLLKLIEENASYGFNKSHSAAYASLAAATTYLKFKYPLQFFLALLKQSQNEPNPIEEIQKIQAELHHFGIRLLAPDLLKSDMDFTIEGSDIRFGLGAIKGISEKTIEHLNGFKTQYSNRFELFEGAKNAGLGIGVLCALIMSGCLDSVKGGASRTSLVLQAQSWNILTPREKRRFLELGKEFDFNFFKIYQKLREEGFLKASRDETFKKKYAPLKAIYEQNSAQKELADYFYSTKFIGYSPTVDLYTVFKRNFDDLVRVSNVLNSVDEAAVQFVGRVIEKVVTGKSKKGTEYAKWTVSDGSGQIDIRVFNTSHSNTLDSIKASHNNKLPTKDDIVFVSGVKKQGSTVFARMVTNQCVSIVTSFGQLKKVQEDLEEQSHNL